MSPIASVIMYFYLESIRFNDALGGSVLFWIAFTFSSYYFQPDLDIHPNRPYKGFPLGKWSLRVPIYGKISSILSWLWFHLWTPYALLLTHRGVSHWPILGTLTRFMYIGLFVKIIDLSAETHLFQDYYELVTNKHISDFKNILVLAVYISDICHTAVDMVDSLRKGYSFQPPKIPSGFIAKLTGIRFI